MPNLKFALRTLFKTPFVTIVAIVSLALGIGANAAIFSLFNQMLLRPLPVPEPRPAGQSRGARARSRDRQTCSQAGDCDDGLQLPDVPRSREGADAVYRHRRAPVLRRQPVARAARRRTAQGMLVSGSYFPVLGLKPALGRLLDAGRRPRRRRVARRRAQLRATGRRASRVDPGVAQPDADRQRPDDDDRRRRAARASTARRSASSRRCSCRSRCAASRSRSKAFDNRRNYWAYLFARLKPGVSIEQARTAIDDAVPRDHQRRRSAAAEGHERRRRWRGSRPSRSCSSAGSRGQSSVPSEARRRR